MPIYSTLWETKQENFRPRSVGVCERSNVFTEPLPISHPYKMSLLEEARRVAGEFEYPAVEVNKGVKEFIRQMSWYPCL